MARLNIERNWWTDARRGRLIARLGCGFKADGVAAAAWQLAQDYWYPSHKYVPLKVWKDSGIPSEFIEVGLAEIRDDGVYVKGTRDHFQWLFNSQKGGKETQKKVRGEKPAPTLPASPSQSDSLAESDLSTMRGASRPRSERDIELEGEGEEEVEVALKQTPSALEVHYPNPVSKFFGRNSSGVFAPPDVEATRERLRAQMDALKREESLKAANFAKAPPGALHAGYSRATTVTEKPIGETGLSVVAELETRTDFFRSEGSQVEISTSDKK